MKVFIFGAGASYGSQGLATSEEWKIPVSNSLFNDIYISRGESVGVSKDILIEAREKSKEFGGVEKYLTKRWEEIKNFSVARQRAEHNYFGQITWYIWYLLKSLSQHYTPENAYRRLIRKLYDKDEQFGIINFNYDTYLDRAISSQYAITFNSLKAYLNNDSDIKYIKPHGSINWYLPPRTGEQNIGNEATFDILARYRLSSELYFNGNSFPLNNITVLDPLHNDMTFGNEGNISHGHFGRTHFYPLIFAPLLIKRYKIIENFENLLMQQSALLLTNADEINIIGYKAQDELIHEMFKSVNPDTIVNIFSPTSPISTMETLKKRRPDLKYHRILNWNFQKYVDEY